jgi:hypothetical protein
VAKVEADLRLRPDEMSAWNRLVSLDAKAAGRGSCADSGMSTLMPRIPLTIVCHGFPLPEVVSSQPLES